MQARRARLTESEKSLAKKIALEKEWEIGAGNGRVLDAAYELFRYRSEGKLLDKVQENKILQARSAFPFEAPLEFKEISPDHGHRTALLGLKLGENSNHVFGELSYRGALHDLLSDSLGYEPYSELTMGDLALRWEEKLFLEKFEILKIRSLPPLDSWIFRKSWSFHLGYQRFKSLPCAAWNCAGATMGGSFGAAFEAGPVLGFLMGAADIEAGKALQKNYRIGIGPSAGLWIPFHSHTKLLLEGEKRWKVFGDSKQINLWRASLSQDIGAFQIRAVLEQWAGFREASVGAYWYF